MAHYKTYAKLVTAISITIFQHNNKSIDEVKLAVAPCGSSEKNCWGWEGVSTRTRNQESTRYHANAAKSTSGKQGEASTQELRNTKPAND